MTVYILFALGFVLLINGANWLVSGASALARRLGVSTLVIGLTVVAFGTSTPELVVSLLASMNGSADIAIGNVIGSNIANILLILGMAAVIYPLRVGSGTVWREIPLSLSATLLLAVLANDALINGRGYPEISRIDGIILLSFFVVFLYYIFSIAKVQGKVDRIENTAADRSLTMALGLTVAGLLGLMLGGRWVVNGAVELARALGASESIIGLTIVAIGTSLPELVTSAVAAYRKNFDIAVGNVVGSNVLNVLLILGVSSVVRPIPFPTGLNPDILMAIIASALLFLIMFFGQRHVLERRQGIFFLFLYVAYIAFLIWRETAIT